MKHNDDPARVREWVRPHVDQAARELWTIEAVAGKYDRPDLDDALRKLGPRRRAGWLPRFRGRAVIAACVVLVVGGVAVSLAYAGGLPILGRFIGQHSGHATLNSSFDLSDIKAAGTAYGPHWLPNGYVIDGVSAEGSYTRLTISNDETEGFGFLDIIKGELSIDFDTDHGGRAVSIGGEDGYLTIHDGTALLIWRQGFQFFRLQVPDAVDIVRIAESVRRIE